jgi:hypothetical protein
LLPDCLDDYVAEDNPVQVLVDRNSPQCGSGDDVALKIEDVVDGGMHAQKALGGPG